MKVAFITLGCKVNTYESDAIENLFIEEGCEIVSHKEKFDAVIINTCSVTNQATAKSRKLIRQAIRNNQEAIVAVIGCYAQMASKEIADIKGVDIILGNINKAEVVKLVMQKHKDQELLNKVKDIMKYRTFEDLNVINFERTRAFLKIEDGCNNFCTYCIIPYTRGPIRCKDSDKVIENINEIVGNGYKEIVLTGIHTGHYFDGKCKFTDLIRRILTETKVERLRISSIEINEITDEFLQMMKDNQVLAHHLHLPLQAGSDHVLKMMNRHYNRDFFINRIKEIREYVPDISITTDIIVGFPEETAEDFNDTLALAREVHFAHIHCFPFSLREGTKAQELKQVTDITKTLRQNKLLELDKELEISYYEKFINQEVSIIIEDKHEEFMLGHSSNYLPVLVPYQEGMEGKMVKAIVTEVKDGKVYGKLAN